MSTHIRKVTSSTYEENCNSEETFKSVPGIRLALRSTINC